VVYKNVQRDSSAMKEMLAVTGGEREVPVLVEGERTTVGYGGS
jgi:hypothetical protein